MKGENALPSGVVARFKYISRNGQIMGYYSGYTFANQLGITTQVPFATEIVTNNSGGKFREVSIKGQRLILRKPKVPVDKDNYKILQLLDLLKDLDVYADKLDSGCVRIINQYITDSKIEKKDIDEYISQYPDKIYRILYETGLYNAFTQ